MPSDKLLAEELIERNQVKSKLSHKIIDFFTCCDFDFEPRNCCGVSGSDNSGRCIWCGIEYPKCIPETICAIISNVDCMCFEFDCLNPFLLTGCPCFLFFMSSCCRSVKRDFSRL